MNKIILTFYVLFLIIFTFFTYLFIDPGFFYFKEIFTGISFSQRLFVSTFYILLIFAFFIFYFYFIVLIKKNKLSIKNIKTIIFLSFFVLVFSYPTVLSYDIFNYMATAKVTFLYKENPYMVMPVEFVNDPILHYTRAANKYALYGPFWIAISGIPFYLSFQNTIIQMYFFKILTGVFYLFTVFLLYKISKSMIIASLFALNPFILIEILVSGHNDIVMVFLALYSFYLVSKRKIYLSILFIFFSILIKFATFFLLPVFIYILWEKFKKKEIRWSVVWKFSSLFMLIIFFLTPFREELYPWYFIWVIPYILLWKNKIAIILSIAVSFGFLFYYIPYMYTGHYILITKYMFTGIAAIVFGLLIYFFIHKTNVIKLI